MNGPGKLGRRDYHLKKLWILYTGTFLEISIRIVINNVHVPSERTTEEHSNAGVTSLSFDNPAIFLVLQIRSILYQNQKFNEILSSPR
jgi:hypothetical protein